MSFTLAMQHAVGSRLATTTATHRAINKPTARSHAPVVVARASSSSDDTSVAMPPSSSRRSAVLFAGLSAALAAAGPAKAARYSTVCDPTADGADCRANEMSKDAAGLGDYEAKSSRKARKKRRRNGRRSPLPLSHARRSIPLVRLWLHTEYKILLLFFPPQQSRRSATRAGFPSALESKDIIQYPVGTACSLLRRAVFYVDMRRRTLEWRERCQNADPTPEIPTNETNEM